MNLNNIIPNNDKWKIDKNIVYVHYLAWIPIMNIKNDWIEVYFDVKLHRYILQLLPKLNGEFYLVSPVLNDPDNKSISDLEKHRINIKNMLSNYANSHFFHGFQKINFDLISHLISYCKKWDCMLLIKEVYDTVNKEVQSQEYGPWGKFKYIYIHSEEIRQDFNGLYRQIKLAEILNNS